MVCELEASLFGNIFLPPFDLLIVELLNQAAFNADQVIMMIIARELEHRVPTFEMMAYHQSSRLKLGQNPINSGQPDFFIILKQMFIDILGTQVVDRRTFEDLKDLNARQCYFQTRVFKILRFCSHGEETHCTIH